MVKGVEKMNKFFRLGKKQKIKQVRASVLSIVMFIILMFQPVFASTGPGTETLRTDEGEPVKCEYVSDYSTSQIDKLFSEKSTSNGRIETDKSVVYGEDDYMAFETYKPGEFSVTLSALGQKFADVKQKNVKVPLDVVLVLDISGSMSVKGDGKRAHNMVKAVNETITYLMNEDENNRVAVVAYNNCATKILPLGRYYVGENKNYSTENSYFSVGCSTKYKNYKTLNIGQIRSEKNKKLVGNSGNIMEIYGATYIQDGIKAGADILTSEKDTTYMDEASEQRFTRTPHIILLSDGVPTLGNSDYKNLSADKKFGDGMSCDSGNITEKSGDYSKNDKGILGYYTILTSMYYKEQISFHYNKSLSHANNRFYTIGVGVKEGSGYDYISQVLHPTKTNLERCKNSTDPRAKELYKALTEGYTNNENITVGSANTGVQANSAAIYIKNPYTNYDYADNSKMEKDKLLSSTTLTEIFKQFLQESSSVVNYYSSVEECMSNAVVFTDNIGNGMEIKESPILIYNGTSYEPSDKKVSGQTIAYSYRGRVKSATYGNDDVDLKKIVVTVTTDSSGNQTLKFQIPSELVPENVALVNGNQYQKAMPIRLCFKVGITKDSILKVADFENMEQTKMLYTNKWDNGNETIAVYIPNQNNPYYYGYKNDNPIYPTKSINKEENLTKTREYVNSYGKISCGKVAVKLGNNGKLKLSVANLTTIYELPDTGGIGKWYFVAAGVAFLEMAVVCYLALKLKNIRGYYE